MQTSAKRVTESWESSGDRHSHIAAISRIRSAWEECGIPHSLRQTPPFGSHFQASIPEEQRDRSLRIAFRVLTSDGWKACVDRRGPAWSLFAFRAREGSLRALRIDWTTRPGAAASLLAPFMGRAPSVAVVGPDGVGKSSALDFVRQWFLQEAPFITVLSRQWRPSLLPALGRFLGRPDSEKSVKPRREPGNFHLLRLAYYYVDFLIGSWWKDRRGLSKRKLVLYDRCAIDMTVDPYRFGLTSPRGTRTLWKMSPKPAAVILLYDEPANIYQRKRELEMHEMESQLRTWLALGEEGIVDAIVEVDGGPEEIGRRLLDLLVDTFVASHEHELQAPDSGEQLSWIVGILNGGPREVAVHAHAEPARHFRELAEFAVVPNKWHPRFLIPLGSRLAAARSLQIYNPQRPFARVLRRLLAAALRIGIARPLLRDRLALARRSNSSRRETLPDHLSSVLGQQISVSVSVGTEGPNRKPVLQVMNSAGRILGYAKVGWNETSIGLVRNEEETLRGLEGERFATACVPRVAHAGWWNELYVLLLAPTDGRTSASPYRLDARHIRFLIELLLTRPATDCLPFPDEPSIAGFKADGFHYYAHLLASARRYCFERVGVFSVPCGPLHGDFTSWNIRPLGDRLLVLDWESARAKAPAGWDLFRFLVSTAVEVRGEPPGAIYRKLTAPGMVAGQLESYFKAVAVEQELVAPIFVSYLAEELAHSLSTYGVQASRREQQLRRSWATLLALSLHRGGPGTCTQG